MAEERRIGEATLRVAHADITRLTVDAVVNAANERLAHGGGVAAALARAGGPQVQRDSDAWIAEHGPVAPGQAAVTPAGAMPAQMIVHVVGPRFEEGQDNEALLEQAVRAALDAAADQGASSVALPAISAGIFGFPPAEATRVIAASCAQWLADRPGALREVVLVGFDAETTELFQGALNLSHDIPDT
ncbi:MAG: macro domain-containing protein [Actinobacteria bacterium]|nr:macro domain-containing protein [Actinomycetota bacterium]